MTNGNVRSVAILGGGITGLSAAAAFRRAMPHIKVIVIDCPIDSNAVTDRVPITLPAVHKFHDQIGITEADLLRSGAATHRLATQYEGLAPNGSIFQQFYGECGFLTGSVPFHHLWARSHREGRAQAFESYAPAAVLASAQTFVHPEDNLQSPLSSYDYALRLDPARYQGVLKEVVRQLGAEWTEASLSDVELNPDSGISALILGDGRRVEADLFLDCAGPTASLRGAFDDEYMSDSAYLPIDRLAFLKPANDDYSPVDSVMVSKNRWTLSSPNILNLCAWVSSHSQPEEPGLDGALTIDINPGRRTRPWHFNVVALGDAAMQIDPLVNANLTLVHTGINRLQSLLASRNGGIAEAREYNRLTALEALRVRDFAALHYLNWPSPAGDRVIPESLSHSLDQFVRRGRLPFHEEEIFPAEVWIGTLIALGFVPQSIDPVAYAIDVNFAETRMQQLASSLSTLPSQLPSYPDYLHHCISESQRRRTIAESNSGS